MKGHTHIIRADGASIHQEWDHMPDLEFFCSAVGGHIEGVPMWPIDGEVVFCNEEGKLENLPFNLLANSIWMNPHDILVGDIVVISGDDEFMREL